MPHETKKHVAESVCAVGIAVLARIHSEQASFGLAYNNVNNFLHLVRYVDFTLDNLDTPESRANYFSQLEGFIQGQNSYPGAENAAAEELFLAEKVAQHVSFLSDKHGFYNDFRQLFIITESLHQETNIENYAALTIQEANLTAKLLLRMIPGSGDDNWFTAFIFKAAQFRNLYDNAEDLAADYQDGKTKISPTSQNQRFLRSAAFSVIA